MSNDKSLESWIWDAACSIRGAQEAPKFKDFILPLIFTKRLCDVFDDELNRIAQEVGSRAKAFKLVEKDHKLVRFYLPLQAQDPCEPVWSVKRLSPSVSAPSFIVEQANVKLATRSGPRTHGSGVNDSTTVVDVASRRAAGGKSKTTTRSRIRTVAAIDGEHE